MLGKIREGDLIEIVFNSQWKFKGYFVKCETYCNNSYKVFLKDFISGKQDFHIVNNKTLIRKKEIVNRIYCITCLTTNKKYIGRTINSIQHRFRQHFEDSKKCYSQTELHKDMAKYGKKAFKVEELFTYSADRQKDANKIEQEYIKKYNTAYPNGYNQAVFGV